MSKVEVSLITTEIQVYNPIAQQLAEIKAGNAAIVFNYEDPEDNKKARSLVFRLRQLKGETERKRKEEKAASLDYGRRVDAAAKAITEELDGMIDVHAIPIAAIEQMEKDRVAAIQMRIQAMEEQYSGEYERSNPPAEEVADRIDKVQAVVLDGSFEEFLTMAALAKDATLKRLKELHAKAVKAEAEAAELERLRKAEEERLAAEEQRILKEIAEAREEQIRKEGEERARREAEEKAKQAAEYTARRESEAKEAADRRELELKLEKERAEKERAEAIARAERIRRETEERMKAEQAERERREQASAERRRKDKERVEMIRQEIAKRLSDLTPEEAADEMMDGDFPHITVNI